MANNVEEIVTDQELDIAWGNADFGNNDKRHIVKHALLKCASGYYTGRTAKHILSELGLTTETWEMTPKGRQYLFAAFSGGVSV
jgi:hypothetical protein